MGRVRRGDGMKTQNLTQKNTVWKYMRHCNEVRSCLVLMKGISFGCETSKVLWPCVPYQSYRSVVRYWSFRQNGKKSEICKLRWLAGWPPLNEMSERKRNKNARSIDAICRRWRTVDAIYIRIADAHRHLPIYESVINAHGDETRVRSQATDCITRDARAIGAFAVLRCARCTLQCWSWFLEESESVCHLISFRSHSYRMHIEREMLLQVRPQFGHSETESNAEREDLSFQVHCHSFTLAPSLIPPPPPFLYLFLPPHREPILCKSVRANQAKWIFTHTNHQI